MERIPTEIELEAQREAYEREQIATAQSEGMTHWSEQDHREYLAWLDCLPTEEPQ